MRKNKKLSESQIRIMKVLKQSIKPITYEELANKSGCSYDGVRGRISELKHLGLNIQRLREGTTTLLRYDDDTSEPISTENKLKRPPTYGDIVGAKMKSIEDYYLFTDFLNKMRKIEPRIARKPKEYDERVGMLVLSDLHFGSIIKKDNKVVYNTKIGKQRIITLANKVIQKCADMCVNDVYIAMIGDMIEGDMIYKNQVFYVEKPAIEQVKDAVEAIISLIRTIEDAGIYVRVGCVRGNHGITNYKNLETDNWDNVVYDMIRLVLNETDDPIVDHFQEDQVKVKVGNKQVVLYHGDRLGEQCKTSAGLKTFRGLCGKHKLKDGDIIVVGHLHTFGVETDQCKILIRNGALNDASEYALKLNLYDTPSQTFVVLEDDKVLPDIFPLEIR